MPDSPAQDKRLVDRCLAGEAGAWDEIDRRFKPFMVAALRSTLRRCRARQDQAWIEDVLQETFLSLIKDEGAALKRFDGKIPLKHLLMAIAVRRTFDRLRRETPVLSLESPAGGRLLWKEVLPAAAASPAQAARSEELRAQMERGLAQLASREQAALRFFYWEGLSVGEIARLLDLRPVSARSVLSRAREKLRGLLSAAPPPP